MRQLTEIERSRIWQSLPLADDRQAILLNYPSKDQEHHPDEVNRNLFCLDGSGNVIWQVKPPLPFQPSGDPFVHIKNADGVLKATRFFGDVCEVDLSNGLAKIVDWTK